MFTLVLVRHGESVWNLENRFTGWTDVGLTDKGEIEAREAGRLLHSESYRFDVAFTSVLKRANKATPEQLNSISSIARHLNINAVDEDGNNLIKPMAEPAPAAPAQPAAAAAPVTEAAKPAEPAKAAEEAPPAH